MRRLNLLIMLVIGCTLSSCAALSSSNSPSSEPQPQAAPQTVQPTTQQTTTPSKKGQKGPLPVLCPSPKKSPIAIQVYPKGLKPAESYKVLGKESVPQYNLGGIKRQQASIHDSLRDIAASLGGDAIIDIQPSDSTVSGTIVSFDNKKVS